MTKSPKILGGKGQNGVSHGGWQHSLESELEKKPGHFASMQPNHIIHYLGGLSIAKVIQIKQLLGTFVIGETIKYPVRQI